MEFDLTDEQRLIQETVRSFVDERVLPNAIENDIAHRLDMDVIEGMAELGLLGIVIPEEYGGDRPFMRRQGAIPNEVARAVGAPRPPTGARSFEDVEVPAENLDGEEGQGIEIAMYGLDQGRFTVAAGACGVIRACLAR